MKKINLFIIIMTFITVMMSSTVYAGNTSAKIKVTVNNKTVKYDKKPYLKDGDVMLPVKQTAEAIGATVELDKKKKTTMVNLNMMHVELIVGKSELYIHRDADFSGIPQIVKLGTPIESVNGTVYITGKTFLESLGMNVNWNRKNKVFSITIDKSNRNDLSKSITYKVITKEDISGIKKVNKWFDNNYKKSGIHYIRDGKYIYTLIGAGEKPTGGYAIKIDNIFYSTYDTITVNARVTPPGDNVRVMMVITYPSTLIRIESDRVQTVIGEILDNKTSGKEKWITMDASTVTKMELYSLDQVKLRDITGTEEEEIMKSFNEATLDPKPYVKMIAGNLLKVTTNDGYVLTFSSYGSETNVIVNFEKDGENRTFHLIAPVIAKTLLK